MTRKGIVFDIKKYAIDDGPGIRTTIFLKGCPLHCWWCHNPEGQASGPELMHRRRRCIGCGECVKGCSRRAISLVKEQIFIDRKKCDLCGKCSSRCPTGALTIVGKEMSVREVMEEINEDSIFYGESGGGVTFSGGEPLLQFDFLDALLEACREKDLRTAVDTSGYASHESIDRISGRTDLFLYDLKIMDDRKHRKYTGMSNKLILDNFRKLAENRSDILVRFPIIPGINDDEDNVTATAEFILSQNIKSISLLPYHRSGVEKYKNLNRAYRLKKIQSPSDQKLRLIKDRLETFGLKVRIGGG